MSTNMKKLDVVCAIIFRGDTVLIAKHPPQHRHAGKWEFPGGKIEAGESAEQAIAREISEELEVTIRPQKVFAGFLHEYPHAIINLIPVVCAIADDAKPLALEHAELSWTEITHLENVDFCDADLPVAQMVMGLFDHGHEFR